MNSTENKHTEQFKQLGLNITFYRKMKNLTQLQLAEKLSISRTHMSNIEAPNMCTSLSLSLLFDIADALEIDVCKLLERRI
ncbi:MAG: helix-turn-helix domain-containing protein [Candidatus Ornithomonoglobus sp.]